MADPFSIVYDALWTTLEAHSDFTDLVPVGNRIKFNTPDPIKAEVSSIDLPEVRLVPLSFKGTLPMTSNSTRFQHQYEVQIATGNQQVKKLLFPTCWEMLRALADWSAYLKNLTWTRQDAGGPVELPLQVIALRTFSAREGVLEQDLNRGIIGWSLIMTIEADIILTTADM